MNIPKLTLVVALTSALIACGGGSSSSPASSSSANAVSSVTSSALSSSSEDASSSEGISSSEDATSSQEASSSEATSSSDVPSSSSSENTSSEGSNSSGGNASESNSSSDSSDSGEFRPALIEGFAAYTNVTGGQGGTVYIVSTGTELNQALCGPRNGNRTAPVVILVNGTINHANTTPQGCDTQTDLIEIKNTSNVSIIGVGTNALFDQIGIHVRGASNIIIQNVHIRNVKKSGTPTSNGGDAIGMESNVDRVWIDHNWLEASGGEKDGYDSLLDMKAGVTNVTVSYNLFNDSSRGGLIGSSDSDDKNNNITFHHNWYKNIEQRTPLIRNALVHMYNNYWSNENRAAMIHGINARMATSVLVESNYFQNVNNPLLAGTESPQAGCWATNNDNTLVDHIYTRTVGSGAHVIPEIIDGQMQSTCPVTVPYSVGMDTAVDVPEIVMANAGVGKIEIDTSGAITVPGGGGSSSSDGSGSSSSSGNPVVVDGDWTSEAMIMGGGAAISGSVTSSLETEATFTITGGKFESAKEGFFFINKVVGGDFVFTANLSAWTTPTRSESDQGSVGVMMCVDCANGGSVGASARIGLRDIGILHAERLASAGSLSKNTITTALAPSDQLYLRVERAGNVFTLSYSVDGGATYAVARTNTFTYELPEDVQVGLYAAQGNTDSNGFTFENISLETN